MIDWSVCPLTPVFEGVDRHVFESAIKPLRRPAILRGAGAHWPLVHAGLRGGEWAYDWLAQRAGPAPVNFFLAPPEAEGRFTYTDDLTGFAFQPMHAPLAALLKRLTDFKDHPRPPGVYAGAVRVGEVFADRLGPLDLGLLPPDADPTVSLWIGNSTTTAAHWDQPQNLACVIAGRRRFTLFPIEQVGNLYFGPPDRTPAGQAISLVDFARPDLARFPRFADAVKAAEIADLSPGDVLYLPSLWIHHVQGLDPLGAMVNFWWRDGNQALEPPGHTLLHALLTLRDLPEDERMRWRVLFDHYIFQMGGPSLDHVPAMARGIHGALTPQTAARIKAMLLGYLGGGAAD